MRTISHTDDDLGIRPLTARSVLLSTLLGLDPPELPAARLVATAALFGIEEGTARVALSRMAAAGEVAVDDGRYRLTGRLLERQRRQLSGRRPHARRWDGSWHLAVVVAGRRSAPDRARLRAALVGGRFAEWRDGVWLRPSDLDRPALAAPLAEHLEWSSARPDAEPAALAAQLWDLDGWDRRARALLARLDETVPALESSDTAALAPGFVLAAAVLRHLTQDPLLPPALLPPGWAGPALREAYEAWDRRYQAVLRAYHRAAHP